LVQKYYSIQAQGKRLEDVLSKEELRQLTEYVHSKPPTLGKTPNPSREYGDLIEGVEPRSSNAGQEEAGPAKAEVCLIRAAAVLRALVF